MSPFQRLAAVCFLFLAACFTLPRVQASTLPSPAAAAGAGTLNNLGRAAGNTFTLGGYDIDTSNLAKHSPFKGSANGGLLADLVDNYKPPNTTPIPVKATMHLPPAGVGKALGRFAAKQLPLLNTALALQELLDDLGYTRNPTNLEFPLFKQIPGTLCSNGTCIEFHSQVPGGGWHGSADAAMGEWVAWANGNNDPFIYSLLSCSREGVCEYKGVNRTDPLHVIGGLRYPAQRTVPESSVSTTRPARVSDFQTDVQEALAPSDNGVSNPGRSDKIGRALQDAIRAGESVPATPQALTGPATQPVSKSETTKTTAAQPATGSTPAVPAQTLTTTSTTVNNYVYNGPTITVTTNTTNVTRNQAGEVVTTDTTSAEPPDADTEPEPETATDSALPAVPKLYEAKYPEGLTGVWSTFKDGFSGSGIAALSIALMPKLQGQGHCPEMPINLTFASWADFGTKDVAPPCYVWDWARLIVLASAFLLARGLVFGG